MAQHNSVLCSLSTTTRGTLDTRAMRYEAPEAPKTGGGFWEWDGPFCGYDAVGEQTWEQFLSAGPLKDVRMPSWIEAEIRAYAKVVRK